MNAFWEALTDPDIAFLRIALLMGLLASPAFGITGSLVVVKRISYVAGAISHAVLGGIGAALYFREVHALTWLHPITGAMAAALLAAAVIAFVKHSGFEREDSVIGAVWAVGMAVGLVFIARTPGFTDPMSYLFGNLLILSATDLILVAGMNGILLGVILWRYNHLQAICFDEEQARLRGLRVGWYDTLLLCLVALTVVLLVSVVGVVLVVALLTIPPSMAGRHIRSLGLMMAIASVLTFLFIVFGVFLGFLWDWPVGPSIILLAGSIYLMQSLLRRAIDYRR